MKSKLVKCMISILGIATLGASSIIGCGKNNNDIESKNINNLNEKGMPIVNEPITLKAFTQVDPLSKDFNEMEVLKKFDEETNIDVQYESVSGTMWDEKKNLILASGDLPDIFFGGGLSNEDIAKYGELGTLVPLEDLIDKYAPNIKKLFEENPEVKKTSTAADGHIYTLPYIDGYQPEDVVTHLFINKKWLEKLGLEIPKTTNEFYEVMRAFKSKDPNGNGKADEIPLTYRAGNDYNGDFSFSGAFGVIDSQNHIMLKDDKVVYTAIDDGYKEYIKWISKLYKEELLDKEIFTHEQGQYVAKGKSEETILGAFLVYNADALVGEEKAVEEYIALDPLVGPNGNQLWGNEVRNIREPKFAITSSNKNPQATIRWVDQFFEEDSLKAMEVHIGEVGTIIEKKGDKFETVNTDIKVKWENCPGPYAPGIVSEDTYKNKLIPNAASKRKTKYYEQYKPYLNQKLPLLSFTSDELNKIGILKTDLNNYIDEMKAKWITGQSDIETDWKGYTEQLKKMGAEDYIKIYKDAYERYKNQ